jgi:hypothetical protein
MMGWRASRTASRSVHRRRPHRRGLLPYSLVLDVPGRQINRPGRGASCPVPRGSVVQGSEDAIAPARVNELWSHYCCTPTGPSPGTPMPSRDLCRRCPCHRPSHEGVAVAARLGKRGGAHYVVAQRRRRRSRSFTEVVHT